ncbi:GNAT family N-acetyltransferase [Ekhidna sp.]|uniref:GNAT family N-acetyltransferase n=1 Tax=Ekhidna sp. TaxID=2608089 RepID=UPI0032EF8A22
MQIKTERLYIREATLGDASFFFELMNSPGWIKYIGDRGIKSLDDAKTYIESLNKGYTKNGFGLYLISDTSNSIGVCGLLKRDYLDYPDLGFALLPKYTGLGYIQEASAAVLKKAFKKLLLPKVLAITSKENFASQSTLEKLGFEKMKLIKNPEGEEVLLYEKLKAV